MPPKTRLDEMYQWLKELHETVHGDGDSSDKPGLKLRIDRLEQNQSLVKWLAGTTLASAIAAVAS